MPYTAVSRTNDFSFPEGTFDVREWEVRTTDDRRLGRVDDLLVDETGAPRYLDLELEGAGRHVLMPMGQARVDQVEDVVRVPGLYPESLQGVPAYGRDVSAVDDAYERRLGEAYHAAYGDGGYYERPEYHADGPALGEARPEEDGRLASLDQLPDLQVAEGEPDPRGWEVVAADGRRVGEVDELIVDTAAMKVRYLDCDLDQRALHLHEDRHVLIPVGYAELVPGTRRVRVGGLTSADVGGLAPYRGAPIAREDEDALRSEYAERTRAGRRWEHPGYRADRFYRPRSGRSLVDELAEYQVDSGVRDTRGSIADMPTAEQGVSDADAGAN